MKTLVAYLDYQNSNARNQIDSFFTSISVRKVESFRLRRLGGEIKFVVMEKEDFEEICIKTDSTFGFLGLSAFRCKERNQTIQNRVTLKMQN